MLIHWDTLSRACTPGVKWSYGFPCIVFAATTQLRVETPHWTSPSQQLQHTLYSLQKPGIRANCLRMRHSTPCSSLYLRHVGDATTSSAGTFSHLHVAQAGLDQRGFASTNTANNSHELAGLAGELLDIEDEIALGVVLQHSVFLQREQKRGASEKLTQIQKPCLHSSGVFV